MTSLEKGAWLTVGIVVVAYGCYLTTIVDHLSGGSVDEIVYQDTAVPAGAQIRVCRRARSA